MSYPSLTGRHDIDIDGSHEDDAFDDLLPERLNFEHLHPVIEARHDHGSHERSADGTDAATHRGSTDEAGRNRIELPAPTG